jgi:hypothetical protein
MTRLLITRILVKRFLIRNKPRVQQESGLRGVQCDPTHRTRTKTSDGWGTRLIPAEEAKTV